MYGRLLNEVTEGPLKVGTWLGYKCVKMLLNQVTDDLLDVGTCSGHVCI